MKLLIVFIALSTFFIIKKKLNEHKSKSNPVNTRIQDLSDLYAMKYKSHNKINTEFTLTQQEESIFNLIKSEEFKEYNFSMTGGWIRDKVYKYL